MTEYARSTNDLVEYANQIVARLCPAMLPYEIGTPAVFEPANFNGRPLGADALDVMLTLAGNNPLVDGVAPDQRRIQTEFPYFGDSYTAIEQAGIAPVALKP